MDKNIGKRLDGRYELLELIGVGGMADIYKARDMVEDKIVAAKILKNELAESEDFLRRFRNESKAIALLSHPNIVKIFDVGFSDKIQFIVMEHIDGITLTEYIERQGVLKWRDAIHFLTQILRALQHAHDRGIVHRDIKSQNVMLLSDGTIKVMDFGIARFNRETDKTISEKAIGSVHYISPEQARGENTDEKSDIYSVGVMLFEMLTGRKPFDGDNPVSIALMHMQNQPKKPSEINSSIPDGLEEITLKAMQKEPIKRYQTAGEMINDIEEFKKNPSIVFEYKYFSTDQNTKYFDKPATTPAASSTGPIPEKKNVKGDTGQNNKLPPLIRRDDYDDDDDDDDYYDEVVERRSPLLSILFATASVFVIMAAWLIYTIVTGTIPPTGTGGNTLIRMPNLVGMDFEIARTQHPYLNLVPEQEYSSEYIRGQITRQNVQVHREIRGSQQITIGVSMGPQLIELRNYENFSLEDVIRMIDRQGFNPPRIIMEESSEVPADFVIRTDPPPLSMIEREQQIIVWVSIGGGYEMTRVPDMRGLSRRTAEEQANMHELILLFIDEYDEEVAAGNVIRQEIEPLTEVERHTQVEVFISMGPRPEQSSYIQHRISESRTGSYVFDYYIDGILDQSFTQNVGLNKLIRWDFEGTGVQRYAIEITSPVTGRTVLFVEYEVDFTGITPVKRQIQINEQVFREVDRAADAPAVATPEPDPVPPPVDPAPNPYEDEIEEDY
jgi:serine/threonine-protein kinase